VLALLVNVVLGLFPTFALGASISMEADDDDRRRRHVFLLVYGLWSLTLAMWNWMRGTHIAWVIFFSLAGVAALIASAATRGK
jgi:hypothetical protein